MTIDDILRVAPLVASLLTLGAVVWKAAQLSNAIQNRIANLESRVGSAEANLERRLASAEASLASRLESRLASVEANLESRLESTEAHLLARLDSLNTWAGGYSKQISTFFGIIIEALNNRQQLTPEELARVLRAMADLNVPAVEGLFSVERFSRNPLAPEELARLEGYYDQLRAGRLISYPEVQDYNRLVAVLQRERPADPGIWPLVTLGAFLTGIMIGRGEGQ